MLKTTLLVFLLLSLTACSTSKPHLTLGDIDITDTHSKHTKPASSLKSNDEIRKAYANFLKHSAKNNKSRTTAINRLAELEFELGDRASHKVNSRSSAKEDEMEAAYISRLNKTIDLISLSLQEYPKAKGNEKLLYNLANAYDQLGKPKKSLAALNEIVNEYPDSSYYLEAQFRVAEQHFSEKKYATAEDEYTNIIFSEKKDNQFIEKSMLKRGWAKFKQEYYEEAIDDFLEAVAYHYFDEPQKLSTTEKDIFSEYFRAIALSFSNMGDLKEIDQYLRKKPKFKYAFQVYSSISDIYFKQNRYSDSAETLLYFVKQYPRSQYIAESQIKVIDIWRLAGFPQKSYAAIDSFYLTYHPASRYWKTQKTNKETQQKTFQSLKEYILLMSKHFHNKYQTSHKKSAFANAKKWYRRYLNNFSQHSRKDNIHFLYAQLLSENNNAEDALPHYEKAAYDSDIILNKEAAYSTILISSRLHQARQKNSTNTKWLDKHIKYATLYNQLYPNDQRSAEIIAHAAELAFSAKQYSHTIELTKLIADNADSSSIENARITQGQAYLELKQFNNAESIYKLILDSTEPKYISQYQIKDKLAFSIFQQGNIARNNNNTQDAIKHFSRIAQVVPQSNTAPVGLGEAINIGISKEMWEISINMIKEFQALFPRHKLNPDISKKLSVAYLRSGKNIAAAQEYEKISKTNSDRATKIAALWKAAELYESNNKILKAINAYSAFAKTYNTPYLQNVEAKYKLVFLYDSKNIPDSANLWRNNILTADKKIPRKEKTVRTKFIVSSAALMLAKNEFGIYKNLTLTLPLKKSLKKKKNSLQKAVNLFAKASSYGVAETKTEATHSIAEIYNTFSQALLSSERPSDLNNDELAQYEILLEDQAFPFEEKAIEFYEANLTHIKDGHYGSWIQESHNQLKSLFPAKYQRDAKIDAYINVLH